VVERVDGRRETTVKTEDLMHQTARVAIDC
jgi:hypothetical protein